MFLGFSGFLGGEKGPPIWTLHISCSRRDLRHRESRQERGHDPEPRIVSILRRMHVSRKHDQTSSTRRRSHTVSRVKHCLSFVHLIARHGEYQTSQTSVIASRSQTTDVTRRACPSLDPVRASKSSTTLAALLVRCPPPATHKRPFSPFISQPRSRLQTRSMHGIWHQGHDSSWRRRHRGASLELWWRMIVDLLFIFLSSFCCSRVSGSSGRRR